MGPQRLSLWHPPAVGGGDASGVSCAYRVGHLISSFCASFSALQLGLETLWPSWTSARRQRCQPTLGQNWAFAACFFRALVVLLIPINGEAFGPFQFTGFVLKDFYSFCDPISWHEVGKARYVAARA